MRKGPAKTVIPKPNRDGTAVMAMGIAMPLERRALDDLFSVTYEELRRLASSVKRSDQSVTLTPTALVNEAWLKLANSPRFASTSRLHFKRIAARAMRQVLVEAARRRNAHKRGGPDAVVIPIDDARDGAALVGKDLLALDRALDELAKLEPRQALMVESRFFGGLDIGETAELLDVSEATILRDWRAAKAWLAHELRQAS
jgi:RNA polymerase sigma factor (TIGR02999 family)